MVRAEEIERDAILECRQCVVCGLWGWVRQGGRGGWVWVGAGLGVENYMCSDLLPIGSIVGKHGAGDHWILWRAIHLDRPLRQPAKDNGAATDNKLWWLFHLESPKPIRRTAAP